MKKIFSLLVVIILIMLSVQNLKAQVYCTTGLYSHGCTSGDYLTTFNFVEISQSGLTCTSDTAGYNDFTSLITGLTQVSTYPISGILGYSPDDVVRVWIDYNDDGTFNNDSTELVFDSGYLSDTNFLGNITIPLSATIGTHRMRTRVVNGIDGFDACSNYYSGCVNDYLVNINAIFTPYLTASPTSHNFNYVIYGSSSAYKQFDIMGYNLTGAPDSSITATVPTGFKISLSPDSNYVSSVSIPCAGATLTTPVYIKFVPTDTGTVYSAYLKIFGCGASSDSNILLSGSSLLTYCTSGLYNEGCMFGNYLTDFSIGTINQTGLTCTSGMVGYNDFTLDSTKLTQGYTYPISGILGTSPDQYVRIWIDFNDDGTFNNDSTELVYTSGYLLNTTVLGNVTIPITATPGPHRMRVRVVSYTDGFDACSTYYAGCVNDYIAIVNALTIPYLTASPTSHNFNYVIYGSSSAYKQINILGYNLNGAPDSIITVTVPIGFKISLSSDSNYASSINIPCQGATLATPVYIKFVPIAANTVYSAYLKMFGCGASSDSTVLLSGTSLLTYCTDNLYISGCSENDYLTDFSISTISQTALSCTSGASGYNDYTLDTTKLMRGNTYTISGILGYSPNECVRAWIDYNDNIVFSNDSTELIYDSGNLSSDTFSGNITIPITAIPGTHRMRVRVVYNALGFDACTNYNYGCANDYIVNIIKHGSDVGITSITAPINMVTIDSVINPKITIHNFGDTTLSLIPVVYKVNSQTPISENWSGSLAPADSVIYSFATTFIAPSGTSFNLCAYTKLTTDQDTLNDKTCIIVNLTPNGIIENNVISNISIYPNPTKGELTIETNLNTAQRFEIVNLIGQTVYTNIINKNKTTVNTSAFANGVYFIKLSSNKETVVRKFVKE